jgi:TetR/AcrR family transcriptional regulator, mexJK operon transcriptional repressor
MTPLSNQLARIDGRLRPVVAARKRGRPTRHLSGAIRSRMVDVALRHFILSGFEGASIARIAREAGVSRQLIHQRYGNKTQLFDAVMIERETLFYAAAELPMSATSGPVYDTLFKYAETMVTHLLQPERVELARVMYGGLYRYPTIAKRHLQSQNRAAERIAAYLGRALIAAGVSGLDTLAAANDFRALLLGIPAPVVMGLTKPPGPTARRERIAGLVSRFMRGIGLPV